MKNRQIVNSALVIGKELKKWNRNGRLRIASGFTAGMLVLFLGLLPGSTPALHAQITATISGTVYDATAGAIPNANITLRNEATDEKRDTVTNSDGVFVFPALQIGTYTVEIRAKGFKILTQTGISVSAAESRKLTGLN
ncbi:MAG TPA: carboxypeptidase-like regulatory domain-containing protein, partial [Terracidiphilus sp.]